MVERNILQTLIRKQTGLVTSLRRNCLVKHVTEGKVEGRIDVMERGGRTRKQLLE
jgi:hypothetical protein